MLGYPAMIRERSPQEHFDVGVEAAEFVAGPAHQRVVDGWVDPEQDLSAVSHVYSEPVLTTGDGG